MTKYLLYSLRGLNVAATSTSCVIVVAIAINACINWQERSSNMKIFRNCIIMGLAETFILLLLIISYSLFLPKLSVTAIVIATALIFGVFELGILTGVIIMKISRISGKT